MVALIWSVVIYQRPASSKDEKLGTCSVREILDSLPQDERAAYTTVQASEDGMIGGVQSSRCSLIIFASVRTRTMKCRSVLYPTSTHFPSVIVFKGPGVPSYGFPGRALAAAPLRPRRLKANTNATRLLL
jgi:hypothetical protein